ncbi:distal tail protein Dit [Enterococcus faecalis]|uniref:distal tail protein Dit n=1 Tax=Enterococcus faecalis TaxID=1351 RepID=UPI001F06731C|nr:distal tail protein Dit [Enterococcus faecalis]MCH1677446.1 phage tail family protein [Enterococcus faecalis]MCH1680238.1 phage tail family protein [Enterococcus faecalis]
MKENYNFLRSFTFDGKETSHLFQIAKVNVPFLSKDNDFFQIGNTDGKHFRNTRLGDFSISIDGFIISDNSGMTVSQTKDELVKIINSDEPKRLILDQMPDRYFNAIFTGTEDYDATDTKYTPFTLTFDVPDALAHQVEASNFNNVTTKNSNMVLDSNFERKDQYYKPWAQLAIEKVGESNVLSCDFTAGIPAYYTDNSTLHQAWFFYDAYNRRMNLDLEVGTKVTFRANVRINVLDNEVTPDKTAELILIEWADNPIRKTYTHVITIPNEVKDWTLYEETITIKNSETTGLSMNFGLYGDAVSGDISEPMFSIGVDKPLTYQKSLIELRKELKVVNKGTYKAYPRFSFKMNSDNGMVGLVNKNGDILQFGNPEEVDYTEQTRMETVQWLDFWGPNLPDNMIQNSGFISIYPNYLNNPDTPNLVDGTLNMTKDVDSVAPQFTSEQTDVWHGPTAVVPIIAPSTNDRTSSFIANVRFIFTNYKENPAMGHLEFMISDTTGSPVINTLFRDSLRTANYTIMECWYKGKKVHEYTLDKKKFGSSKLEINIERSENYIKWRLASIKTITKNDNVVVGDNYIFTYNVSDKSNLDKFGFWFKQYSKFMGNNLMVTDAKLRWLNVKHIQNVRNYYKDGDLVELDTYSRNVYINGAINNELNVVGNQWEAFRLGLGEHELLPFYSTWALQPEVNCILEQTYL